MGRSEIPARALVVAALLAPAGLAGCSQMTYGTGEVPEVAMFREATGSLVMRKHKQPIDYEPRAPLVMPPSNASLPAPVQAASASDDPDWPIDPNAQIPGAPTEDPHNRMHGSNTDRGITSDDYRRLKPLGELAAGAPPTPVVNNDTTEVRQGLYNFINQSHKQHATFGKALAQANGYNLSERRYLTDPPIAYEKPAETAPTEFNGVGKKRGFWRKMFPGADADTPTAGADRVNNTRL